MKVIISGGGTGGHIYPGVAIAKKIKEKEPKAEILFIGSHKGLEKKLVPKEGFNIKLITVEGLNKKFSIETFSSIGKAFKGYFQASKIIKDFKPDVVIGTGGYVCGPVVLTAAFKGIPTIIHEQNAIPGMTNKILSRFVTKIAISFKASEKYFPKSKTVFTGNPVRNNILKVNKDKAREFWGFDKNKPLLLVVGGSRGAKNINNAVVDIIPTLNNRGIQLLFITGENQYDEVIEKLKDKNIELKSLKGIKIMPYVFNMQDALGACDLIVSRAGATILSEITAIGLPAILIPSPYVANNHQEFNALALEENGAAIIIKETQLKEDIFSEQILNIINNHETLLKMSVNSKRLAVLDAADKIFEMIQK
ncbi:UDP-diphospho-muramoylpentapeptide beta-N- acetylglucosaminyltransferase [Fervidicella metallireducens AeB]|uniref:UDP-N-acetylglucosamine--N-acetylmuramyl-(pentapeptide) pyrophosphoryl-undecaprenol N-acetylglucosamine transferase n=1 Tax=Fervidicella metallireducens AeB TaxID=1403537 RepID=A0A017RWU7_9CLOT|nr:undecaprenyldiphospho-muramoylpentapeptide beta-N-acetylglucosaminyltransferase [Fervidicella metallireducens]EYE88410.1 UDP-diphospho-muramoylpentapeptide beta-N- acetylglucosaminyltransferase [Fervidicella metallireducens AeB]